MKSKNNTLMSIGLGLGALVFAFFLIFSDPQQGGQVMQQIQKTASDLTKTATQGSAPSAGTALAPEGRLDGFPLPGGGGNISSMGSTPTTGKGGTPMSSAQAYLDSAWDSPQAKSQGGMQQVQPQQQRGRMGMPRGFGGFGQQGPFPQGGFNQMMQQPNQNAGNLASARGAVEYELSYAKSQAAQASSCMDRAKSSNDGSEKDAAASEARSHAGQARAAASRAASRASGIPELQGLVGQARHVADQAEYSAEQASSAAAGW